MRVSRLRVAGAAALVLVAVAVRLRAGPLPTACWTFKDAESTDIVDRHGEALYEARSGDGSRASWLAASSSLPSTLVDATIAPERSGFFRHPGVDPIAAVARRCATSDIAASSKGIDNTQQVAAVARGHAAPGRAAPPSRSCARRSSALRLEHRFQQARHSCAVLESRAVGNQLSAPAGQPRSTSDTRPRS